MVLAALLVNELLLTASLSTVLAVGQTLSLSSAEFWPLELCASLLCLADSKTWSESTWKLRKSVFLRGFRFKGT